MTRRDSRLLAAATLTLHTTILAIVALGQPAACSFLSVCSGVLPRANRSASSRVRPAARASVKRTRW